MGRLREQPPTRTKTLPGMHVPVRPPPLPGEFAPTTPAPSLDAPTVRYTPERGLPAQNPEAEAQRRRAEAAETKLRELTQQFPPPVSEAPKKTASEPAAKLDKAIGSTVRLAFEHYSWKLLAVCGIGAAILKPAADPKKTEATLANTEAIKAQLDVVTERQAKSDRWIVGATAYMLCLEENQDDNFSQVLPDPNKQGAAQPLRAYVKQRCQRLRP